MTARVQWTRDALGHALDIREPHRGRIFRIVRLLATQPRMGHEAGGLFEGSRRFVVPRTPYAVVYMYDASTDELLIETVGIGAGLNS